MAKNTSIAFGSHFSTFVETQIANGRYASASEVIRAGLRLLEEREMQHAALRKALLEGEESGVSDKSVGDIWAEVEHRHSAENG